MCDVPECGCHLQKHLKLEVGKTYLTYEGRKVKIHTLAVVSTGYDLIGEYLGRGTIARWSQDGKVHTTLLSDLVAEYHEPDYRWFNSYKGFNTPHYRSPKDAARNRLPLDPAYVGTYRIDLNTGDITREEG